MRWSLRTVRSFPVLSSLVALALALVGGGLVFAATRAPTTAATPPAVAAGPRTRPAPGTPAIHPTLSGAAVTRNGGATYTVADVQQYLAANPGAFPPNRPIQPLKVAQIAFMTREQAEANMHGESLDGQVPPGGLVCYVKLTGPFSTVSLSMPAGAKPWTASTGEMVFDAQSGNLIVWGLTP
jgi:hypothetical protein